MREPKRYTLSEARRELARNPRGERMRAMPDLAMMPTGLTFRQEWQRIVFAPNGERQERFDSGWYDNEAIARSLLNHPDWPEPTSTGYRYILQTRWVSEHRRVALKVPHA